MDKINLDDLSTADLIAIRNYLQNNCKETFNEDPFNKATEVLDWIGKELRERIYEIWLTIPSKK